MSKNKTALLAVYQYLKQNTDDEHGASTTDILAYLKESGIEIGRKALYDTVATLSESGVNIQQPKGRSAEYRLLDRTFEVPELKAIIDSVAAATFLSYKKSAALIGKLKTLASCHNAVLLDQAALYGAAQHTENERLYYNVDGIMQGMKENRQISFAYTEYNLQKERVARHNGRRYEVSPLAMAVQNDRYYLLADSKRVEGIAHFRIDRMEDVATSKKHRSLKKVEGLDVSKYVKEHFQMFSAAPVSVSVRFPVALLNAVIDRFGAEVKIKPEGKSHFVMEAEVRSKETFFAWLFTFSSDAVLLSPQTLKEEYLMRLSEVFRAHRNT